MVTGFSKIRGRAGFRAGNGAISPHVRSTGAGSRPDRKQSAACNRSVIQPTNSQAYFAGNSAPLHELHIRRELPLSRRRLGLFDNLAGVILTLRPQSRGSPDLPDWVRKDIGLPPIEQVRSFWDYR